MNKQIVFISLSLIGLFLTSFNPDSNPGNSRKVRPVVDTIGFAHLDWQVDSVMNRINRTYAEELSASKVDPGTAWKVAICPHDDYTYTSWQYPALLKNIKARTVIIFGVAHKARQLNISDQVVFDSYSFWIGPYGEIKVSPLREELIGSMPKNLCIVSDSLQRIEHSVESMLPFLQYFNRDVEIISILVPFMDVNRMSEISGQLSSAIAKTMKKHRLEWGKDIAILITTDAVHYGDEDWGGKNMAPYGVDSIGYAKAINHEHGIIDSCLVGAPNQEKVRQFVFSTVQADNYKEYKWTWCGRYSVPLGLMTAIDLQKKTSTKLLNGKFIGYSTSIDHKPLPVDDLRMGRTANATMRHWVGYASVGYE
jgi:MEMO1 family protein